VATLGVHLSDSSLIDQIPTSRYLGLVVIAERYAPDFIAWVSITTKDPDYPKSFQARFLRSLALKAEVRVYVTAELGTLLERRGNVDPSFLRDQIRLYEEMTKHLRAFKLDTAGKSPEESERIVLGLIKEAI
jgi:hypothetical protein